MIGSRLKLARINAKLTQFELGVKAGLDEETAGSRISQYENNLHNPDFKLMCRIAEVLGLPECYFYTVDDDMATLVLQYYQYRKKHPNTIIVFNEN